MNSNAESACECSLGHAMSTRKQLVAVACESPSASRSPGWRSHRAGSVRARVREPSEVAQGQACDVCECADDDAHARAREYAFEKEPQHELQCAEGCRRAREHARADARNAARGQVVMRAFACASPRACARARAFASA
eukprot:1450435-Pleurochrysis_carterae.AAC.4